MELDVNMKRSAVLHRVIETLYPDYFTLQVASKVGLGTTVQWVMYRTRMYYVWSNWTDHQLP